MEEHTSLSNWQRILFLSIALLISILLVWLRGQFYSNHPFEKLARESLPPEVALANGRPTIFEFYADWCEACKEMAPSMLSLANQKSDQIDIVLLNVDNSIWDDLIESYEVKGIPQLELFDNNGFNKGRSLGLRSSDELIQLAESMIEKGELPEFAGVYSNEDIESISYLVDHEPSINYSINPRSHG